MSAELKDLELMLLALIDEDDEDVVGPTTAECDAAWKAWDPMMSLLMGLVEQAALSPCHEH